MELPLDPVLEERIRQRVRQGGYASAADVISAGLAALDQQEALASFAPGELDGLLAEGEASLREHGTMDGDEAFSQRRRRRSSASDGEG